jgi:hypothetical protein
MTIRDCPILARDFSAERWLPPEKDIIATPWSATACANVGENYRWLKVCYAWKQRTLA